MSKREAAFKNNIRKYDVNITVHSTDSIESACKHLKRGVFDIVFLDHDLEEWHYGIDIRDDGTGSELTLWLKNFRKICEKHYLYVIHSVRPKAAKKMAEDLSFLGKRCIILPYAWTYGGVGKALKTFELLSYQNY
jgi:hypothetical protein